MKPGDRRGQVRTLLMEAALSLVASGQHFASLGIREIARQAGVVPTSFYRHFRDMDDLGLALVDELSLVLRKLMRDAREKASGPGGMLRQSVDVYIRHVDGNRAHFLFLCQEMAGGSPVIRQAIRSELNFFANELVSDLVRFRLMGPLSMEMTEMTAGLAIQIVSGSTMDLLDVPSPNSPQRQAVRARLIRYLQMVFVAAGHWKEKAAADVPPSP